MELQISKWVNESFETIKTLLCDNIRKLDSSIGKPPFANPSSIENQNIAKEILLILKEINNKNRIHALAEYQEVNMTFPVLIAAFKNGSENQNPCKILLEIFLEIICLIHSLSLYPIQSILNDAKEILPTSPVTFKLFIITGAMSLEYMHFFLGLPFETKSKEINKGKTKSQLIVSKKNKKQQQNNNNNNNNNTEEIIVVPKPILNAALEVILPEDCMKLFLTCFNNTNKFQKNIGNNSEIASRLLYIYGNYLIPHLKPISLLYCLDATLIDIFIDIVQMHGESMTLLTENIYLQIPLNEWDLNRLKSLIFICFERNVRSEEAFASLIVYIFIFKVLLLFCESKEIILLSMEEEIKFCFTILNVASMISFNVSKISIIEEERLIKPLSIVYECIRKHYNIFNIMNTLLKIKEDENFIKMYESVNSLIEMLMNSINAKLKVSSLLQGEKKEINKKKNKKGGGGKKNNIINSKEANLLSLPIHTIDNYCKLMAESLSLIIWFSLPNFIFKNDENNNNNNNIWFIIDSLSNLFINISESEITKILHKTTWESYLNLLLSALCIYSKNNLSNLFTLNNKTNIALLTAIQITHRLECCGFIAQKMPNTFNNSCWNIKNYKILLDAWLTGENIYKDKFFESDMVLSSTEIIGIILNLLNDNNNDECFNELIQYLLYNEETNIIIILIPKLEYILLKEPPNNSQAMLGLSKLHSSLLNTLEEKSKQMLEQQEQEEIIKQTKMLESMRKTEELLIKSKEFEKEAQKRKEIKEKEYKNIQEIRIKRGKEKEERKIKEKQEQEERRKKTLKLIKEMKEKTKKEKEEEQRERLYRYRERISTFTSMSSFLEALHLPTSKIMHILSILKPYLQNMTQDELLEYIVTGNREVPKDMHVIDDKNNNNNKVEINEERVCFSDEAPSFWDSVMQLVAKQSGDNNNTNTENQFEISATSQFTNSFHRRVSNVLNLFDYSLGKNSMIPDILPSINIRIASRILGKDIFENTEFINTRDVLLACQQRGLCVLKDNSNICTLTPLGFRYHFPFHDPEFMLDIQIEQRRVAARAMLAEFKQNNNENEYYDEEEEEEDDDDWNDYDSYNNNNNDNIDEETNSSERNDDVICFTDEPI